jgi:hypothetical protein
VTGDRKKQETSDKRKEFYLSLIAPLLLPVTCHGSLIARPPAFCYIAINKFQHSALAMD